MKFRLLVFASTFMICLAGFATETNVAKVKFVLIGDSTVNDAGGWGYGFKQILTTDAACANIPANGRSSKSFIDEGLWAKALAEKGDYYLIQFGHNDEPGKGPKREIDPPTTFRNITATAAPEQRAGLIWGLPEMNVTNVLLENVQISADKPLGVFNAQGVRLVNCRIFTPSGLNKIACINAAVEIR